MRMRTMKAFGHTSVEGRRSSNTKTHPSPLWRTGEILMEVHAAAVTLGELAWDATWRSADGSDRTRTIASDEFTGVLAKTGPGTLDPDDIRAGLGWLGYDDCQVGLRRERRERLPVDVLRARLI